MADDVGGGQAAPEKESAGLTLQNVALLQDAFTTLSLRDKCLILSGVEAMMATGGAGRSAGGGVDRMDDAGEPASGFGGFSGGFGGGFGGSSGDRGGGGSFDRSSGQAGVFDEGEEAASGVESDVASVMTESDRSSLDVAMKMMAPEELVELEREARVLQKNMKAWMMCVHLGREEGREVARQRFYYERTAGSLVSNKITSFWRM
jgi:hypothetical protein